jgi:hypothetical protein
LKKGEHIPITLQVSTRKEVNASSALKIKNIETTKLFTTKNGNTELQLQYNNKKQVPEGGSQTPGRFPQVSTHPLTYNVP